ncbi:cupin domain-containing protein [Synechococcus sp. CCY 9618]|uniref:cupin domain-containing protein n=1 Tax=Synechococcus sp. CCY 9618 TaxID=2815602 RepID=UPI001C248C02|nr:cupin domain-containing protein [Synechococcus sp. CCY 9618]
MGLSRTVELLPLDRSLHGEALFSSPLASDETLIAEIGCGDSFELFCHRFQTDQLLVLRGAIDLVVLQNRRLRPIPLREGDGTWVRIPPGVPHGAINRGRIPALLVNAVLRHGPSDPRDYRPLPVPAGLRSQWRKLSLA